MLTINTGDHFNGCALKKTSFLATSVLPHLPNNWMRSPDQHIHTGQMMFKAYQNWCKYTRPHQKTMCVLVNVLPTVSYDNFANL